MKQQSLKKNILLSTFKSLLAVVSPFITAPYTARVLGVESVGINSYLSSVCSYFTVFAALGTAVYGTVEIAKVRDDKEKRSAVFWGIKLLNLITFLIALLAWGIFCALSSSDMKIYYLILTGSLFATLLDTSWFYSGIERYEYKVTLASLIKVAEIVCLFLFVKKPADLSIYMLIGAVGGVIFCLLLFVPLPKYISFSHISKSDLIRHLRGALVFFIPSIAHTIYSMIDKTLLGIIVSDNAESGYYAQAASIVGLVQSVSFTGLNNVLMARNSYLYQKGKFDEIKERINSSINYILFIGIGAVFGFAVVVRRFVPWFYGPGYEKTGLILVALSPVAMLLGISGCLGGQYYNPAGLRKKTTKYQYAGVAVNLVLDAAMIPFLKGIGAAVASVIAELLIVILYVKNSNNYCTIMTVWSNMWKKLIAGAIMFVVAYPVGYLIENVLLAVVAQVLLGLGVYIAMLFVLRDREIITAGYKMLTGKIKMLRGALHGRKNH